MSFRIYTYLIIISAAIVLSCKANPQKSKTQYVVVELTKGLDAIYILESYAGYSPKKVKTTNKTLNRYGTQWALSDIQYRALIKKLSHDSNVTEYIEDSKNVSAPMNSTNAGKAKATPKIK